MTMRQIPYADYTADKVARPEMQLHVNYVQPAKPAVIDLRTVADKRYYHTVKK